MRLEGMLFIDLKKENGMTFKQPPRLEKNDKVAIISPSSGMAHLFPWVYEQGLKRIQDVFQLQPIEFSTARQSSDELAKNPQARAKDINTAFADPSIKAVIATIGGNDQIRVLPYLDQQVIFKNPKIFMGYSDCTNVHLFLWKLGIISYYGGSVMNQFARGKEMDPYTIEYLKKALFDLSIGHIHAAPYWSDADLNWADSQNLSKKRPQQTGEGWEWHQPCKQMIKGKLWGGCVETLSTHLSIQHYLPTLDELEGCVLFIETSEEMPSADFVYDFIAKLSELKMLQKFQAILVAYPKTQFCNMQPPEGREVFRTNQKSAIKKALKDCGYAIPVIFNMNFGHTDPQIIIPNGGSAIIDNTKKTICFN
jgi:muramoyltetrapeptide carboxypeptidase LdcA involved in peptidoglycan recycling